MPVITGYSNLGSRFVPQEIKDLRRSSFDYHRTMGMPVFIKHRWNYRDYQEGRARLCPYHDEAYGGGDLQFDEVCFGTGFIGGFADAVMTYITMADATEDTVRIGPGGVLIAHTTPAFTAPWTPDLGDGDLLITGDFDSEGEMVYPRERYILGEVDTITMRGFQERVQTREFPVNQQGQLTKLPWEHGFYKVPFVFDYGNLPDFPVRPPGYDPDDWPTPDGTRTERSWSVAITGRSAPLVSADQPVRVTGLGSTGTHTTDVRVEGEGGGVEWYW